MEINKCQKLYLNYKFFSFLIVQILVSYPLGTSAFTYYPIVTHKMATDMSECTAKPVRPRCQTKERTRRDLGFIPHITISARDTAFLFLQETNVT